MHEIDDESDAYCFVIQPFYSSIKLMMNTFIKQALTFNFGLLALIAVSSFANADIYQWRDANGGMQFGNNPPKGNSSVVLISKQASVTESEAPDAVDTTVAVESPEEEGDAPTVISKSSIFRSSRRSKVLYQGSINSTETRIISVRLLRENKNTLIFDVNYYLSDKTDGTANIGIVPNMDNYSSAYTKAHPGRHATTITVKLSNSSKPVVRSSSLKLSMALANETGYVGPLFEHDLSFNKVWYKK